MVNETILNLIDSYCQEENAKEPPRTHLGASVIGQECERKTWYGFRWASKEKFSGRILRLFKRGHLEEIQIIKYLRAIGFRVEEIDPRTGKQWRISGAYGHFGGSGDGVLFAPESLAKLAMFPITSEEPILFECKTISDKYFKALQTYGVKIEKPQHWAQMCTYGFKMGIQWALYITVNKNNDALHIEFIKLDLDHGERMVKLAEGIIFHQQAPDRRFDKTHYKCRFCNFKPICHFNEPMEKNCRSCTYARPIQDGEWYCGHHVGVIPKDFIAEGCSFWEQLDNR